MNCFLKRFWAGPIAIFCSNYALTDWVRQSTAFIIQSVIIVVGHAFFLVDKF